MEEWGGAIMDARSMEEWGGVMYTAREAWRNGMAYSTMDSIMDAQSMEEWGELNYYVVKLN